MGVLVVGVIVGLIYMKLFGFKKALEELVYTETEQAYSLTIRHASVDFINLSFKFDSLVIQRNQGLPESGIRQVYVPKLQLHVANLGAMLRFKKFDIRTLIIDEPLIDIDNPEQLDSLQEKFHLGQQILKLYPAIESVVERFNIEYLKINRAALGVKNHPKPPLNLSLIDFLIEEWEEGKIGENSQIQLLIGKQEVNFEKAQIEFSALEFNFRKRQLQIDDLRFATDDSLTNSHVKLAAKAVILTKLGYKDLFENQILTYEKVSIVKPNVDLHLFLNIDKTKDDVETNENEVVTRLIKQTIGECNVDTLEIDDAQINLVLQKEDDSTLIALPNVDFTLYTFSVTKESNTFITGTAHLELDKTSIELTDGITISCQKLIFDREQNLNFTDVQLYDAENKMMVAECKLLRLQEFHLLSLLFDKELLIKHIAFEEAIINIPPENIFGTSKKGNSGGLEKIMIQSIALKNVDLNYAATGKKISAIGLSMQVYNLSKKGDKPFEYQLSEIKVANANVDLEREQTHATLQNIEFKGQLLQAKKINLKQQDLEIGLEDMSAVHRGKIDDFKNLDYNNWDAINANHLDLKGILPEKTTTKIVDTTKAKNRFAVAQINVKQVSANLKNSELAFSFSGKNLALKNITIVDGEFNYQSATGTLNNLLLEAKNLTAKAEEIALSMPEKFDVQQVLVTTDKLALSAPNASIHSLEKQGDLWGVKSAKIASLNIDQNGHHLVKTGSIIVKNAQFGGAEKPFVGFIEAQSPEFNFTHKTQKESSNKVNKLAFLDFFGDYILHEGTLHIPDKTILFGKTHGNALEKTLACAFIKTTIPKMDLVVKGFAIDSRKMAFDTLNLTPSKSWYANHSYAENILTAYIYHTDFTGFSMDSLLQAGKFENALVNVKGFKLNLAKDQRLPDPPYVEKPASLEGLLNLPKNISLKSIKLKHGRIDVSQISSKTGEEGHLDLSEIWADIKINAQSDKSLRLNLNGGAKLYDNGNVTLNYKTIDSEMFSLSAVVSGFDMTKLNKIVTPLNAVQIESGHLENYTFNITANNHRALGTASITYDNLHMIIFKKSEPEKKNLGSEILTLLADDFVIKNSKTNASTAILQLRVKNKTTFDYWVKSAVNGAIMAVREGRRKRKF